MHCSMEILDEIWRLFDEKKPVATKSSPVHSCQSLIHFSVIFSSGGASDKYVKHGICHISHS